MEEIKFLYFKDGYADISDEKIKNFLLSNGIAEKNLNKWIEKMQRTFEQMDNHIGGFYYGGDYAGYDSISRMGCKSFNTNNTIFFPFDGRTDNEVYSVSSLCWKMCKKYLKENFIKGKREDRQLYEILQKNKDSMAFHTALCKIMDDQYLTNDDKKAKLDSLWYRFRKSFCTSMYSIDLYHSQVNDEIGKMLKIPKYREGGAEYGD